MKFRFHRGGYKESMETVQEVKSLKDIGDRILKVPGIILSCKHYGFDERNQWDTYIIENVYAGGVIGFSNGPLERE